MLSSLKIFPLSSSFWKALNIHHVSFLCFSITHMGGVLFFWNTSSFLFFHKHYRVETNFKMKSQDSLSKISFMLSHCSILFFIVSYVVVSVLIEKSISNHTTLVNSHWNRRWSTVSSSNIQRGHLLSTWMLLLLCSTLKGKLLFRIFQRNIRCLYGTLLASTNSFHASFPSFFDCFPLSDHCPGFSVHCKPLLHYTYLMCCISIQLYSLFPWLKRLFPVGTLSLPIALVVV